MNWTPERGRELIAPTKVDPAQLASAAKVFATSYQQVDSMTAKLAAALDGTGGMAGSCESGTAWAGQYDPAAKSTLTQLDDVLTTVNRPLLKRPRSSLGESGPLLDGASLNDNVELTRE